MYKLNSFLLKTVLLSCLISSTSFAKEINSIQITDAWISEAPPTVSVLAGYLNIQNNTANKITLLSASSPDFAKVEIHRSIIKDEMVSMEKQNSLEIPAGKTIKLSPGDFHLMLFDPSKPMRSGKHTEIHLSFSDDIKQIIKANVERRHGSEDHSHHHH